VKLQEERQRIREEFREKAKAWADRLKERIAFLERELERTRKHLHDEFMMAAMSNPAIVTEGMTASEAARVCCRYADHLCNARRIEDGVDDDVEGLRMT